MKIKKIFLLLFLLISFKSYSKEIKPFNLPLPEEYKHTSSCQSLRETILIEEIGATTSGLWHNGLDIPCPEKTKIFSAKDGIVTCVYPGYYNGTKFKGHPSYGGLIIINHFDGTITLYTHLSCTYVVEKQFVKQGEIIGLSGGEKGKRASGISTGPHLHFSIYVDINHFLEFE